MHLSKRVIEMGWKQDEKNRTADSFLLLAKLEEHSNTSIKQYMFFFDGNLRLMILASNF